MTKKPRMPNTTPGAASDTVLSAPRTFAVQLVEPVTPCRNNARPPTTQITPTTNPKTAYQNSNVFARRKNRASLSINPAATEGGICIDSTDCRIDSRSNFGSSIGRFCSPISVLQNELGASVAPL